MTVEYRKTNLENKMSCKKFQVFGTLLGSAIYDQIWKPNKSNMGLKTPSLGKGKGKVHLCTGTETLYRPYGP